MQIASVTEAEHADFLALVNAEIRPDRAKTNAWDDFPVILGPGNRSWQLVARGPDGRPAAALACLIRPFTTNWGELAVAGIGSVATRPEFRGQGLSRALQIALLERLRRQNVPLAVLWTDQPEIYAGRGFAAAGWELHVDLSEAALPPGDDPRIRVREYAAADLRAVEELYRAHPLGTRRQGDDAALLYGMPGTRGLVLEREGRVAAAVFCGKGGDFPDTVAEWDGPVAEVLLLLAEVRRRAWAHRLLVPAGAVEIVDPLVERGAAWAALPSGQWAVLRPDLLSARAEALGLAVPGQPERPQAWLGDIGPDGMPRPGPLAVAVWGFDSV